jgi:ribosomal protein L15E
MKGSRPLWYIGAHSQRAKGMLRLHLSIDISATQDALQTASNLETIKLYKITNYMLDKYFDLPLP